SSRLTAMRRCSLWAYRACAALFVLFALSPDLTFTPRSGTPGSSSSKSSGVKLLGFSSEQLFPVTNASLISWVCLIFFPSWRKLPSAVLLGPVINAIFYTLIAGAVLISGNQDAKINFSCLEGIRAMFANSDACFAGWLHYCVFDPLVGLGEVLDSRQVKVPHLLVVPCLFMTMLVGPIGFLMYLTLRFIVLWSKDDGDYMAQ
ncbi:Uncharacterized protein SCF082_LOCUS25072, partial [Durusdinium trenchii]